MNRAACLVICLLGVGVLPSTAVEPFSRHFGPPTQDLSAIPDGRATAWEPLPRETIALIGGTAAVEMGSQGQLEAALQLAFPEEDLRVRNLGWHGDTVYRQQRPLFFYTEKGDSRPGSVPDQRERIDPGTLFLFFGKMESLESTPDEFRAAYESLVDDLLTVTPRICLVSPTRFEAIGPAAALAEERNQQLASFRVMIRKIAEPRGLPVLDARLSPESGEPLTRDGVHLNATGQDQQIDSLMALLGQSVPKSPSRELLAAIAKKERLWDQYYRPTNWAFLFGDRQHVPSSRDHEDAEKRWFVREIEALEPLIAAADERIYELAQ